jgi:predicted HTH domain antitoxin
MLINVNIPDQYLIDTTAQEITSRLKLYTALLMFQAGQFSAGAACEFASVDRYSFLAACKQHNIAALDYSENDLESDFEDLKRKRTSC